MHFITHRKWFYIFSLAIIIPGIISMFVRGFNPGIDFMGGTVINCPIAIEISSMEVEDTVKALDFVKEATVQVTTDPVSGQKYLVIKTNVLETQQATSMKQLLQEKYPGAIDLQKTSTESVGGAISGELTRNAIYAILIAMLLMLVYITFRFEWSFGVAAVLALIHDILIILSIYSFLQWEINSAFVAAILTIIGYSINDTIVIFDRVRENLKQRKKDQLDDLLNKSIMQTLNRSVNTVLTVLMPLIMLLLFGGETLKGFVVTLLIGFLFGMYSSICVASPIYFEITSRSEQKA